MLTFAIEVFANSGFIAECFGYYGGMRCLHYAASLFARFPVCYGNSIADFWQQFGRRPQAELVKIRTKSASVAAQAVGLQGISAQAVGDFA